MRTEIKILKELWKNKEESSARIISKQTGLNTDYVRYLCNYLHKKGQIVPLKEKRDYYRLTKEGEKQLEMVGIIKPEPPEPPKIKKRISPKPKSIRGKKARSEKAGPKKSKPPKKRDNQKDRHFLKSFLKDFLRDVFKGRTQDK